MTGHRIIAQELGSHNEGTYLCNKLGLPSTGTLLFAPWNQVVLREGYTSVRMGWEGPVGELGGGTIAGGGAHRGS